MMPASIAPILIVGAGISGLTLAQGCRKNGIPFRIFERDSSISERSAGWGLTFHWSLPTFLTLLSDDIASRLPETYVHKQAVDAGERGSFTFFDLATGEAKWKVPAAERIRVSRERLRNLMLHGIEVEWSKKASDLVKEDTGDVKLSFSDGTSAKGSLVVGCDGANSVVRTLLHPTSFENFKLPIRFLGVGAYYSELQISQIRNLDPYFLQGGDPATNAYLWFSFLDCPGDTGVSIPERDDSEQVYHCQVMVSWPYREDFMGRVDATDVPNTLVGQRSLLKTISKSWTEPFRALIHDMPQNAEIRPITLSDWVPQARKRPLHKQQETDSGSHGTATARVTLVGDAAHAMVMFRGEGANHAIVDVARLIAQIKPIYCQGTNDAHEGEQHDIEATNQIDEAFARAISTYDAEVLDRTEVAVLASRQACFDANDYARVNEESPLIRRRLSRADLRTMQSPKQ